MARTNVTPGGPSPVIPHAIDAHPVFKAGLFAECQHWFYVVGPEMIVVPGGLTINQQSFSIRTLLPEDWGFFIIPAPTKIVTGDPSAAEYAGDSDGVAEGVGLPTDQDVFGVETEMLTKETSSIE